jgi:hypothetical protein
MKAPSKQQFRAGNPIQTASGNSHLTSAIGTAAGAVDRAANLALSLQKEQEKQDLGEAELEMTRATRRANDAILQNRYSPGEHVEKAAEILKSARAGILNKGKHSAKFRNEMERRTDLFIEGKLAKIGTDAKLMQVENGKRLQLARAQNYRLEGQYGKEREVFQEGIGVYWPKEDAEIRAMESERFERQQGVDLMRIQDPFELKKQMRTNKFGFNDLEWEREKEKNQRAVVAKQREIFTETLNDIVEDPALSDDYILGQAENLTPIGKEKLTEFANDKRDMETQKLFRSEDYQRSLVADLTRVIIDMDPGDIYNTDDELEILRGLETIIDPVQKKLLKRSYENRFSTEAQETGAKYDNGLKVLNSHFSLLEGQIAKPDPIEKTRTIRDHISDGFLQDSEKLQSLGFSEDQIKEIVEAEEDTDSSFFGSFLPDNKVTINAQADKFKDLWELRNGDVTADADAIKLASAFAKGRGSLDDVFSKSSTDDPDLILSYNKRKNAMTADKGRAIQSYTQWAASYPEATYNDHIAKVAEFGAVSQEQDQRKHRVKGGATSGSPGIRTFRADLKLSNYGYASDTTPDKFSKRGIGHEMNKLRDEQSAAISKSLARDLELKRGAVLELLTTHGFRLVTYDDTVPATDKRTGPLPPTIDIYRKTKGDNKWGGKIEGVKVILQGRDGISGEEYSKYSESNYQRALKMINSDE